MHYVHLCSFQGQKSNSKSTRNVIQKHSSFRHLYKSSKPLEKNIIIFFTLNFNEIGNSYDILWPPFTSQQNLYGRTKNTTIRKFQRAFGTFLQVVYFCLNLCRLEYFCDAHLTCKLGRRQKSLVSSVKKRSKEGNVINVKMVHYQIIIWNSKKEREFQNKICCFLTFFYA